MDKDKTYMGKSLEQLSPNELNAYRSDLNSAIELGMRLQRLLNNEDFDIVFTKGYLEADAIRLVGLLGDASINLNTVESKKLNREEIMEQMIGISRLEEHIRTIFLQANMAKNALDSLDNPKMADIEGIE